MLKRRVAWLTGHAWRRPFTIDERFHCVCGQEVKHFPEIHLLFDWNALQAACVKHEINEVYHLDRKDWQSTHGWVKHLENFLMEVEQAKRSILAVDVLIKNAVVQARSMIKSNSQRIKEN
jgi:hypothetical protein